MTLPLPLRTRRSVLAGSAALLLAACGGQPAQQARLCGDNEQLRVGYVGAEEGRGQAGQAVLPDPEISRLRDLLMAASRCEVLLEPVASPEQARVHLTRSSWDAAFLPPGLAALALERAGDDRYNLVRPLGRRGNSRSQLLVRQDSPYTSLAQLRGARLGLLPQGSLTGFYLPLYNLHGLTLASVHYALGYDELLEQLRAGKLDVIPWDAALPDPGPDVRRLHEDIHVIPLGALVLSQSLVAADHQPFLRSLDASASQLPANLSYVAGALPEPQELRRLRSVVNSVESWKLPLEGQPYAVYGRKQSAHEEPVR
ncbi:MAG: phosphate/phosphite/phosphonate ABC transporter substrate-binding protein [Prochlorococcaceae cyanobacterium]|jgi:phosphonate transport system substrate-binding protein